ncbi:hypothetical protein [Belnapia rosea]|uniref:hypothetical protein n=1 Tax=Belnapia rosea TaxID=938405 RepID=UPI00087E3F01|nr:hypothetical protein [Belnapia rosea]SDB30932.1 hypothetical protein SAMN02927895_01060 [Belnapia rosea]
MQEQSLDACFEAIRSRLAAGEPAGNVEVLAAACLLSMTAGPRQAALWEVFTAAALTVLRDGAALNIADGPVEAVAAFLASTPFGEIAQLRRMDPHVWGVRLHAVRRDGCWLVLHGRFDSLYFAIGAGTGRHAAAGRSRDPAMAEREMGVALADIAAGFHATSNGTPPLRFLLANGRPVDQSIVLARLDRLLGEVEVAPGLGIRQDPGTAFIDPLLLPAIAARPDVAFEPGRTLRAAAMAEGSSVAEALYMPDSGWPEQNLAARRLRDRLLAASLPVPPDPGELRLFVSLDFEKRVWVEQEEGFLALFQALRPRAPRITVFLNGMTGMVGAQAPEALATAFPAIAGRERAVMARWQAAMGEGFALHFLNGLDIASKVAAIRSCDGFAAPGGTAAFIATLAGLPGIFWSHPELHGHFASQHRIFADARQIGQETIRPAPEAEGVHRYDWGGAGNLSYAMAPADFLAEAMAHLGPILDARAG